MCSEYENPDFSHIFFQHDCLKICMYISKLYMEGKVSQISDIGFSFCFILCGR